MTRIAIVTDSTCDLPRELTAARRVAVVPLTVTLGGTAYLDGVDITADVFYDRLKSSPGPVSTSQPAPGQFLALYAELLAGHDEIISLHISEKLSGTLSSARQAAEMAPGPIRVIDSESVSMQLGLLVLMASSLADAGASAGEIEALVKESRSKVRAFFTLETLEHLRQGGRIGRASALLGTILQVKPVLTIEAGQVTPLERVRTYERAVTRLVELGRSLDNGHGICLVVGHAAGQKAAERIARELADRAESLVIQSLGPVVGAHAGPGTVGIGVYPAELCPLGLGSPLAGLRSG